MVGAFENLVIKETINPESQNYKKIRPEGNYTVDQVRSRIKDLFGVGESRYTPEVVVDGNPKWQDGTGEAARWTKPQTLQDAKEEKETYKNCPVSDGEWTGDQKEIQNGFLMASMFLRNKMMQKILGKLFWIHIKLMALNSMRESRILKMFLREMLRLMVSQTVEMIILIRRI